MKKMNFLVLFFINFNMKALLRSHKNKRTFFIILSFFCVLSFIVYSECIKEKMSAALCTSLNTVVPSLFPMLIVTYFILGIGFSSRIKKLTGRFLTPIFGITGNSAEVLLTGLTGGYNTAIKSAVKLHKCNYISDEEAKRLALFFTCPGISFCVNICGISVYSDLKTGLIIFFSNVLSCLICSGAYNLVRRNKVQNQIRTQNNKVSAAFIESVAFAVSTTINIIAWIMVFSVISAVFNEIITSESLNTIFNLVGEVSQAVIFSSKNCSLETTAFCLSFGGLCIFLQQLPDIIYLGISPLYYLLIRLINALTCSVISHFLFILFPVSINVSLSVSDLQISSTSIPGSLALLLLGIILLNSIKAQNDKNYDFIRKTFTAN